MVFGLGGMGLLKTHQEFLEEEITPSLSLSSLSWSMSSFTDFILSFHSKHFSAYSSSIGIYWREISWDLSISRDLQTKFINKLFLLITLVCKSHKMERSSHGGGGVYLKWIPQDEEKWGETLVGYENDEIPGETWFLQNTVEKLFLLITLVCKSHEMERTSRGGGGVWTK